MAWYDEAVFYHIYPLGLTGAPKQNSYGEPVHRLNTLLPWISHIKEIGCNAIYIGPLFESVGHGYETTDYKKLDSRLGTNDDLKNFVLNYTSRLFSSPTSYALFLQRRKTIWQITLSSNRSWSKPSLPSLSLW